MIRSAHNQQLYIDYEERVLTPGARDALFFLIGWASTLRSHDFFSDSHGYIRDFRLLRGDEWDFSFIPNQKWLLFYFRKPCLSNPKYSGPRLRERFPALKERTSGEFELRVNSLDEARLLAA